MIFLMSTAKMKRPENSGIVRREKAINKSNYLSVKRPDKSPVQKLSKLLQKIPPTKTINLELNQQSTIERFSP